MSKIVYNYDVWQECVNEFGWPARPSPDFIKQHGLEMLQMMRVLMANISDDAALDLKSISLIDAFVKFGDYIADSTEYEPIRVMDIDALLG